MSEWEIALYSALLGAIAGGLVTIVVQRVDQRRYRSSVLAAFAGQLEILETNRPNFDGTTLYTVSQMAIASIIDTTLSAGVLHGRKDRDLLKGMTAMLSLTTSFNQLASSVTDAVVSHSYDRSQLEAMYGNIDQLTAVIERYRVILIAILKNAGISPMIYDQGDREAVVFRRDVKQGGTEMTLSVIEKLGTTADRIDFVMDGQIFQLSGPTISAHQARINGSVEFQSERAETLNSATPETRILNQEPLEVLTFERLPNLPFYTLVTGDGHRGRLHVCQILGLFRQ